MGNINCLNCKTELPEGVKFCSSCGTKAPEPEVIDKTDPLRGYPPVLNPAQVAKMLNVSINRLYEHLQNGDIPGRKLGRRWRISTVKLFEWLDGKAG